MFSRRITGTEALYSARNKGSNLSIRGNSSTKASAKSPCNRFERSHLKTARSIPHRPVRRAVYVDKKNTTKAMAQTGIWIKPKNQRAYSDHAHGTFTVKRPSPANRQQAHWFAAPSRCIFTIIMAKIFYCGGSYGKLGVLRAVMPFSDLRPLMSGETRNYAGPSFPDLNHVTSAHTVIEVAQEEEDASWKAGFYLVEKTPLHFEDSLRSFCKAASMAI